MTFNLFAFTTLCCNAPSDILNNKPENKKKINLIVTYTYFAIYKTKNRKSGYRCMISAAFTKLK